VDAPTVVIESVKPAEDGTGQIIVRLYESKRVTASCALSTTLPVKRAWTTDLLENRTGALPLRGKAVRLDFRPFEIKTVRLAL
jgi:alpha-mannosidase